MNPRLVQAVEDRLAPLLKNTRLAAGGEAIQHGDTTVLLHSAAVAYYSLKLARGLRLRCDQESLLRGALLHDYFLYDWHVPDPDRPLHGPHHPGIALRNARQDVELTSREQDIILHHMFPLNPHPPRSREAILVCLVDKGCGMYETLGRNTYPALRKMLTRHADSEKGDFHVM